MLTHWVKGTAEDLLTGTVSMLASRVRVTSHHLRSCSQLTQFLSQLFDEENGDSTLGLESDEQATTTRTLCD